MAFVLDSSGSIDDRVRDAWNLMRNFVVDVVQQFDVSPTAAHIGLIRYSNDAEISLHLNSSAYVLLTHLMPLAICKMIRIPQPI